MNDLLVGPTRDQKTGLSMAYPLSQILPDSPIAPCPPSPVMRQGYRRRLVMVLIGAGFLWLLIFGSLAFISVPTLIAVDGNIIKMVYVLTGDNNTAATVFTSLFFLGVPLTIGAWLMHVPIRKYVRLWAGYRPLGTANAEDIPGMRWIVLAPFAGLVGAAIGSTFRGEIRTALAWVAITAIAGYTTSLVGHNAMAALRHCRARTSQLDHIVSHGYRSVAWVKKMRYTGTSCDGLSEFAVSLASDHSGERSVIGTRIFEYPIWAPIRGTEFDVWTTDGLPLEARNADKIVVERRYIGQDHASHPTVYAHADDEHRQRLTPRWISPKVNATARDVHGGWWRSRLQGLALGTRFLGTLICVAMLVIVVAAGAGSLAVTSILLLSAISAADTYLATARACRARWYIRNRFPMYMAVVTWAVWPILMILALINEPTVYCCGEEGDITETGMTVVLLSGALFVLSVILAATVIYPPDLFNRGFEASADAIQQAMTSHDPTLADRLEAETGVRVGIALLQHGRAIS